VQLVHSVVPAATLAIEVARRESWSIHSFVEGDEMGLACARGSRLAARRRGVVTEVGSVVKSATFFQIRVGSETKSYQPQHVIGVIFIRRGSEQLARPVAASVKELPPASSNARLLSGPSDGKGDVREGVSPPSRPRKQDSETQTEEAIGEASLDGAPRPEPLAGLCRCTFRALTRSCEEPNLPADEADATPRAPLNGGTFLFRTPAARRRSTMCISAERVKAPLG
jgi:hypothetical protein